MAVPNYFVVFEGKEPEIHSSWIEASTITLKTNITGHSQLGAKLSWLFAYIRNPNKLGYYRLVYMMHQHMDITPDLMAIKWTPQSRQYRMP